ncbi:hypothetical protein ANN_10646 [Periplaneta americana]|uniref:Uncharacterized protein n=1 Tax=Periplaneta americana TaxID=6978 RepID=A0ABQ8T2U7_PERAM|nr:hypothetical protein ANN_10646 [Periplaneta americana]
MQKYLVRGHTQMVRGCVHSTIERGKKNRDLYSPARYVQMIKEAQCGKQGQNKVKCLCHDFFKDCSEIQYYKSIRPGNKVDEPCVTDISALKYTPNVGILYKSNFDNDSKLLPTLPNTIIGSEKQLYGGPFPISTKNTSTCVFKASYSQKL